MKKIIIACAGDWHANTFARALNSLNYKTIRISNSKCAMGDDFSDYVIFECGAYLKILQKFINKSMYKNIAMFKRFKAFDISVSKYIKLNKPDLVMAWTGMALETLRVCKKMGIPSILVQGNSPLNLIDCLVGEENCVDDYWISNQSDEYKLCDGFLVESSYIKNNIIKNGINKEKIHVLPPHINQNYLPKKNTKEKIEFATIQLSKRKGTRQLMGWWEDLGVDVPNINLFGEDNEKILKLSDLAAANIIHHGHLKGDFFRSKLSESSVALFPTYEDGGPRALFECMSLGLCPIISERSAGPDHILDGYNGFVVELEDKNRWINTIKWCINNPKNVRDIGNRARLYVSENLNSNDLPDRLSKIMECHIEGGVR